MKRVSELGHAAVPRCNSIDQTHKGRRGGGVVKGVEGQYQVYESEECNELNRVLQERRYRPRVSHGYIFASENHPYMRIAFCEMIRTTVDSPEVAFTAAPLLQQLLLLSKDTTRFYSKITIITIYYVVAEIQVSRLPVFFR